jgi:glucuronate isomerase
MMPTFHFELNSAAQELFNEISRWAIYDPHTHIDPRRPAARHFDEIMGYHYYTELADSAGMPAAEVSPNLDPLARVRNLVARLDYIDSTVQYSWLLEIARTFHQFPHHRITPENVGELADRARQSRDGAEWDKQVWKTTRLEAVFLTNEFDDSLEGWDTAAKLPCLRTDDLVLKVNDQKTIGRLRWRGRTGVPQASPMLADRAIPGDRDRSHIP